MTDDGRATPSSAAYPVTLTMARPARFERQQLLLRLAIVIVLAALNQSMGGIMGLLYLLLPIAAAVLISRKGGAAYLAHGSDWLVVLLEWTLGLFAYVMQVSDRLPLGREERDVRLQVTCGGVPTIRSALGRFLLTLPHLLVLFLLGIPGSLLWLASLITVAVTEQVPVGIQDYQRRVLAFTARLLAYHASLVHEYPPFTIFLDDTDEADTPSPSAIQETHAEET